ncbi:hypothetical protein WJX72_011218 [[Myrmecia] bisecta]|uniref:CD2 antigen cytoplasmic tail-binding protein 2 n=1 Tax=[Myrmecia] bisecta TaxID=41462 RepID=A0AAW1QBE5_9CHLO
MGGQTDQLIQSVLQEQQAQKKAKKAGKDVRGPAEKVRKTLAEVEDEEGGVVKESLVSMAQTKRATKRKSQKPIEDTELVGDVEEVEEVLEVEEEDGQKFEPFNLAQERQEGYFDESGHYVENKEEDETEKDAWLTSGEAAVVSAALRRQIEERQRAAEAAEAAPPMSAAEANVLKRKIISILQPEESVMRGLKRLRGGPPRPKPGKRAKKAEQPIEMEGSDAATEAANKEAFEQLTEAASALMDSGELNVYSMTRDEFEKAVPPILVDEDEDMFADDGDDTATPAAAATPGDGQTSAAANGSTPGRGAPVTSAPAPDSLRGAAQQASTSAVASSGQDAEVDYSRWPIKELQRFLRERGVDSTGIVDKAELVAKVKEAAAKGPEGEVAAAPPSYVFDPNTGYFYSSAADMFWDANTGGFYSSNTGLWYSFDEASQQFVQWPAVAS